MVQFGHFHYLYLVAKQVPVYGLKAFKQNEETPEFYSNELGAHVLTHAFTNLPHKHDFYLVMLVTKGSGTHEIDFNSYKVTPGSVFFMRPGQMHYWKLSKDIKGYIFFHSKAFFEEGFTGFKLSDYPFYNSMQSTPYVKLNSASIAELKDLMQQINLEHRNNRNNRNNRNQETFQHQKLHALTNLSYITLSRNYKQSNTKRLNNKTYLFQAIAFEELIEKHFKELRSASDYAALLNISEKHLNRITRASFNKTSSQVIADRIILEAKRLLIHTGKQVTQIAYDLGYNDNSYFVRFFKKNAGETPLSFLQRYKER